MQSEYMKQRQAAVKAQEAKFKAAGYIWKTRETSDSYDPDEPKTERYLVAPDGIEVTVNQALDEIERGRDVVRAEIAREDAEMQERNRIAKAAHDEAAKREQETEAAFNSKSHEIRATNTPAEAIETTWEIVIEIKATRWSAGKSIRKAVVDGRTYYKIVTGTYDSDTTYWIEKTPYQLDPNGIGGIVTQWQIETAEASKKLSEQWGIKR